MLYRLINRLGSPIVASKLSKEEVCLGLASTAKLFPVDVLTTKTVRSVARTTLPNTDALAAKAERLAPTCSPREVAMIAGGAVALGWHRPSLADLLASLFYNRCIGNRSQKSTDQLRLADLISVVEASIAQQMFCSITVQTLLRDCAVLLVRSSDTTRTLSRFLTVAAAYIPEEHLSGLVDQLRKSLPDAQELRVFTLSLQQPTTLYGLKREMLQTETSGSDGVEWNISRARSHIFLCLNTWSNCKADASSWRAPGVVQCMELFAHFRINDPAMLQALEAEALHHLSSELGEQTLREMKQVVYGTPHLFLSVRRQMDAMEVSASANVGGEGQRTESIKRAHAISSAYRDTLRGKVVSGETLLQVTEDMNFNSVDDTARAACIFARRMGVPESLVHRLTTSSTTLAVRGVAALQIAVRWDNTGSLLLASEAAMRRVDLPMLCDTPIEDVIELAEAVAFPLPRSLNLPSSWLRYEQGLKESLTQHLLALMETLPISDVLSVALRARAADTKQELLAVACSRAVQSAPLSVADTVLALRLLTECEHVHEELLDHISARCSDIFEECVADRLPAGPHDTHDHLLQLALLQARFDAPELEGFGYRLLNAVEARTTPCATELAVSAALFGVRSRQLGTNAVCQAGLLGCVEGATGPVLSGIIALLWYSLLPEQQLVDAVIGEVAKRPAAVSPQDAGRLIAVYSRTVQERDIGSAMASGAGAIGEGLLLYAAEHVLAFGSKVYTAVCQTAFRAMADSVLSNALVDAMPHMLDSLQAVQICHVVYGLSHLPGAGQRLSHQLATEKASDYVVDNADLFWSGPDIARLLHGFSRLYCTKRNLYSVFAARLATRPVMATLDRESISLCLSAFGAAKFLDKPLFDRLTNVYTKHAKDLSPADVLLSVKAHSRVMLLNSQFYDEMGHQIVAKVSEFPLTAQCDLLHAYGAVENVNDEVAGKLLENIAAKVDHLPDANKAVDVITSLWLMDYKLDSDDNAQKLVDHVVQHAHELSCQSIMSLCSVVQDTDWRHLPLLNALANQSVHLKGQGQITGECSRCMLDTLGKMMVHHAAARSTLSELARTISKETVLLSDEESEQLQHLLQR